MGHKNYFKSTELDAFNENQEPNYRAKHPHIAHYQFDSQAVADVADATYAIAVEQAVDINQWQFIFIGTLRMLKSDSRWAK